MTRKSLFLLTLACLACCRPQKPGLAPAGGPHFRSMSVKFSFQDPQGKQSGRVHWRFDEKASKFLFFTPLNQVGLELDVVGEDAVLVNFSKKIFWKGDFSLLLDRLWGIGLPLAELRSLLDDGVVPPAGFAEEEVTAAIERDPAGGSLRTVLLRRGAATLSLRVTRSEFRPGRIVVVDYAGRYRPAELEAVLEK